MAKFCSKCGAELKGEAKKCQECGAKIGLVVYPLSLRKTGKVLGISFIVAIAIIVITILVGVFVLGSTDTSNRLFDIKLGWPFGWFQMSQLTEGSSISVGVSNWAILVGVFIFYLLLCFVLAYIGEMFYESMKTKNNFEGKK